MITLKYSSGHIDQQIIKGCLSLMHWGSPLPLQKYQFITFHFRFYKLRHCLVITARNTPPVWVHFRFFRVSSLRFEQFLVELKLLILPLNILSQQLSMQDKGSKLPSDYGVFVGKYVNKRQIGYGGYGEVYLVECQGQEYALKLISKKKMGNDEILLDYLQGEIAVMKEMNFDNIVQFKEFHEDQNYFYLLLQYCEGDLVLLQSKQPNKVFTLELATKYLSQVILGLETLHKRGYLHRDIKLQNILFKYVDGQIVIKIADFGFTKSAESIRGSVLGTREYMAPQIYLKGINETEQTEDSNEQYYGYEVDMWAFGVLFFRMLNQSFPFEIKSSWPINIKYSYLLKQIEEFSYRKAVAKTNKKLVVNCTDQIEDLFRKIFCKDQQKRITFSQIRYHPVFAKHFPEVNPQSQILYKTKFEKCQNILREENPNVANIKASVIPNEKPLEGKSKALQIVGEKLCQYMGIPAIIFTQKSATFERERHLLKLEVEEICFPFEMADEMQEVESEICPMQFLMLKFNLIKYHIVIHRNFFNTLIAEYYLQKYPGLAWAEFFATQQFKQSQIAYANHASVAQKRYMDLYKKCKLKFKFLCILSEYFGKAFNQKDVEITEVDFDDNFFGSYRKSTYEIYKGLKTALNANENHRLYYFICMICICHVFSDLYKSKELKLETYSAFLPAILDPVITKKISYQTLTCHLRNSPNQVLVNLVKKIIDGIMKKEE